MVLDLSALPRRSLDLASSRIYHNNKETNADVFRDRDARVTSVALSAVRRSQAAPSLWKTIRVTRRDCHRHFEKKCFPIIYLSEWHMLVRFHKYCGAVIQLESGQCRGYTRLEYESQAPVEREQVNVLRFCSFFSVFR